MIVTFMVLGIWDSLAQVAAYFYDFLDSTLGFIWNWPGIYSVFIVAAIVALISSAAQYFLVDQEKMREIRAEMSDYQKKLMQARKTGSKKELKKLETKGKLIKQRSSEMQSMTMKPMFLTFIPLLLFFGWVRLQPASSELVIDLPFTLPYFGDTLGWLGWYFLCSFFFSQVLRKVLNMA